MTLVRSKPKDHRTRHEFICYTDPAITMSCTHHHHQTACTVILPMAPRIGCQICSVCHYHLLDPMEPRLWSFPARLLINHHNQIRRQVQLWLLVRLPPLLPRQAIPYPLLLRPVARHRR